MSEPAFLLATDLRPGDPAWGGLQSQAAALRESLARPLNQSPVIDIACLPTPAGQGPPELQLGRVIENHAARGAAELFIFPTPLEFNVWQRTELGEDLIEARRRHRAIAIHHDSVDPAYPLLIDCFAELALNALRTKNIAPERTGLLLVADGRGDAATRADSYRLMRLLWERTGIAAADVGFVKHPQPLLPAALDRCDASLAWVLVPQRQWPGELCDSAAVMLADFQRVQPDAANWQLIDPPGDHPAILAWLEQRMLRLWKEKRARQSTRVPSAKYQPPTPPGVWTGRDWSPIESAEVNPAAGLIGRVPDADSLRQILARVLPPAERYLVKVTWHGYAQGTYTGPAALDRLLSALPGRAILLEGHTSGRNSGGLDIDWDTDAQRHRGWIHQQDAEFLRRTGLAEIIARHNAQYFNVTEAWWDNACAPEADIRALLGDAELKNPELAAFVPAALLELKGLPLISFARFKGPTRLAISNLFGLIPHPLRTRWHGVVLTDLAAACCDVARIFGRLFPTFGLVEAFDSAVRWNRKGLYRSRWGNYDLVLTDGLFTLSESLPAADLLASRLQGQDVTQSAFFDTVRSRLGWSDEAATLPLPPDIQSRLA